jgi:hypothetical protein
MQSCEYAAAIKLDWKIASTAGGATGEKLMDDVLAMMPHAEHAMAQRESELIDTAEQPQQQPQHQIQYSQSSRLSATASATSSSPEPEVKRVLSKSRKL